MNEVQAIRHRHHRAREDAEMERLRADIRDLKNKIDLHARALDHYGRLLEFQRKTLALIEEARRRENARIMREAHLNRRQSDGRFKRRTDSEAVT